MKKYVVRRTYTLDDGQPCNKVLYIYRAKDAYGSEQAGPDFNKAFIFDLNREYPSIVYIDCDNIIVSGTPRSGDFTYKQELIEVKVTMHNKINDNDQTQPFGSVNTSSEFVSGEKVIYIPENKIYDFGYYSATEGLGIIYTEGDSDSQSASIVKLEKIKRA